MSEDSPPDLADLGKHPGYRTVDVTLAAQVRLAAKEWRRAERESLGATSESRRAHADEDGQVRSERAGHG